MKKNEQNNPSELCKDEEIIALFEQRSEQALHETELKYGRYLFSIAYNVLRDTQESEDCKNDAYLAIWNAIPPARPAVFPAFITKITRNIAISRYRTLMAKKNIPSELTYSMDDLYSALKCSTQNETVEEQVQAREVGKLISKFLKGLSPRARYLFIGRYYLSSPVELLASELGLTPSAVYKELGKTKEKLKRYLEQNGVYV